ncbi:MAG: YkgJ family cysteine cluster protein [Acidobacteriota bacterium]|nr:YkgJ family cysteine cluster protein [Acidobacteriota bacterium]
MNKKKRKVSNEVTATINLSFFGNPLQIQTSVPTSKMRPKRMLPVFHNLTASFMGMIVETVQSEGMEISCTKGCGACCRQMVPISEIEAHRLSNLVNEMPEPRKSIIIERFAQAKKRMAEAGLLDELQNSEQITKEEFRDFGLKYFAQRVDCPFLEDESCSIHPDRPIVCREYMVVSPAENCSRLNDEPIKVVKTAFEMSKAIKCFNESQSKSNGWIPLILALDWADAHPENSAERSGIEIFSELLENLINNDVPKQAT